MICTGSRRESLCFYEYQAGADGERSYDKLKFLKRQVKLVGMTSEGAETCDRHSVIN